jgi:cell division protein FtsQ
LPSIAEETFRFEGPQDGKAHPPAARSSFRLSRAQARADRAASAGFVLSMLFLACTAVYALTLSDAAKPFFAETFALADRAAFDAGFRLESLTLSGAANTPPRVLYDALKLPYKGSSLFYGANAAHARLLSIGWIESAEIRRILPSRLQVTITERVPFARWEDESGQVYVIGRSGHLLGPDEGGSFKALPLFAGEGAPSQASDFEEALQDRESLRARIQRIELIAERFWSVKLDNGLFLKLPRKVTPLVLSRLDSLLASPKIAALSLESIDLRLSNRTILQLLEPTVANRDKAVAALMPAPSQSPAGARRGKAL